MGLYFCKSSWWRPCSKQLMKWKRDLSLVSKCCRGVFPTFGSLLLEHSLILQVLRCIIPVCNNFRLPSCGFFFSALEFYDSNTGGNAFQWHATKYGPWEINIYFVCVIHSNRSDRLGLDLPGVNTCYCQQILNISANRHTFLRNLGLPQTGTML